MRAGDASEERLQRQDNPGTSVKLRACRVCSAPMRHTLVDLGMIPLCQSYKDEMNRDCGEMFYPLRADVCMHCLYVGLPEYISAEKIFTEYAYFSSVSDSWVRYVGESVDALTHEFALDATSQVVEMASNDGYLLQFFVKRGIPALGVEPAANVAKVANDKGVPTVAKFFNLQTAAELLAAGKAADLLLAYNCLDHVPDLNDVVAAMKLLLKPRGVIQVEFPYLRSMIQGNQFDTIYHDRFSYLSFIATHNLFVRNGLRVFDVARIPTHGGSLRVRACHAEDPSRAVQSRVTQLMADEEACGMRSPEYYSTFMQQVAATKHKLLSFLVDLKRKQRSIVGYGVPAKGNVLLNYCGIRSDFIDYLVDRSPYKVGKYAPGTQLPIRDVEQIRLTRPDYLFILPWNIKDEIVEQMSFVRAWGGKFFVAIPDIEIL
jgi:SAM-dependent methyltransferase